MKRILFSLISTLSIIFIAPVALADDNDVKPANSVKISDVIQNIQSKGYTHIREIEFDDGAYKAEAINSEGKEVELSIDPQKNEIKNVKTGWKVKSDNEPAKLPMLDAIKKVEAAGYHDIYDIDLEHGKYEVKALDQTNNKIKLKVNANTGDIIKK